MNATPRTGTLKKKAGIGCAAALALVIALAVMFWLIGTYAPDVAEPAEDEPAPTAEVEPEPAEEPAKPTEEPEPAPEPTEEPAPEPEPEPEQEPTTEAEPEPTEEPEPVKEEEPVAEEAKGNTPQVEGVQDALSVWYDDCAWDTTESDGIAMSNCAEHEIGIIVGPGESSVQGVLDAIGEQSATGGYFIDGGTAVWATDMGTVRKAWDAMGAPGTPTEF